MGSPTFLDSTIHPFRYYTESVPASTSTQITSTLRTELTALGWTEVGGVGTKVFRSPANSAGRYLQFTASEPTATRWQMAFTDDSGMAISTRGLSINAGSATTVYYFTGNSYAFVDADTTGGPYNAWAYMLDSFPDEEGYYPHPVAGGGSMDSAGSVDGFRWLTYAAMIDAETAATIQRIKYFSAYGSTTYYPVMPSGRYLYDALWVSQNVGGTLYWTGKYPQALLGPATPAAYSDWVIPINPSTSATFKATSLVDASPPYRRLFMRKA